MMGQESDWNFGPDSIETIDTSGGNTVKKEVPLPEGRWLSPYPASEYFKERAKAGQKKISVPTMSMELGPRVVNLEYTFLGEEELEIQGRSRKVTAWTVVNDAIPNIETKTWFSTDWVTLATEANIGLGAIRTVLADKSVARSESEIIAPEVFMNLMVEPDRPIPDPLNATMVVLRVRTKDGTALDLPSTGCQSIAGTEDGATTIVVDLDAPQAASDGERSDPVYLGRSVMIDPTDEVIVQMRADALKSLPSTASTRERVAAMRSFVNEHIKEKNLASAFASASEVARTRSGDCSEHGVLLAALLRVAPSVPMVGADQPLG